MRFLQEHAFHGPVILFKTANFIWDFGHSWDSFLVWHGYFMIACWIEGLCCSWSLFIICNNKKRDSLIYKNKDFRERYRTVVVLLFFKPVYVVSQLPLKLFKIDNFPVIRPHFFVSSWLNSDFSTFWFLWLESSLYDSSSAFNNFS